MNFTRLIIIKVYDRLKIRWRSSIQLQKKREFNLNESGSDERKKKPLIIKEKRTRNYNLMWYCVIKMGQKNAIWFSNHSLAHMYRVFFFKMMLMINLLAFNKAISWLSGYQTSEWIDKFMKQAESGAQSIFAICHKRSQFDFYEALCLVCALIVSCIASIFLCYSIEFPTGLTISINQREALESGDFLF